MMPPPATGAEREQVSEDKNEFEQADAAAKAALSHARSLPPGPERSEAFKKAGGLRSAADKLRASTLPRPPPGPRPKLRGK
jgi:hypothetical protein